MKNILFVSTYYLPTMGGIEQSIYKISSFLKNNNSVEVAVVAKANLKTGSDVEGVRIRKLSFKEFWQLDFGKYDAILITNFSILPNSIVMGKIWLLRILRKFRSKVLLVPHGGATVNWKDFPVKQRMIKYIYNNLVGFMLVRRTVDGIIAVSDWEKNQLDNFNLSKPVYVIRNGIDANPISSTDKQKYFIFVGRIDPIKNIEGIVEVFSKLRSNTQFQDYKLLVVGDYNRNLEYYAELQRLISKLGITESVNFIGQKVGQEKLQLIANAAMLICLSRMENDPIVVKEAFSVKTKVLINTVFGLGDYRLEENAFIVNNDLDATELASFMRRPFSSQFVNPLFTWKEVARKYEEVTQ